MGERELGILGVTYTHTYPYIPRRTRVLEEKYLCLKPYSLNMRNPSLEFSGMKFGGIILIQNPRIFFLQTLNMEALDLQKLGEPTFDVLDLWEKEN